VEICLKRRFIVAIVVILTVKGYLTEKTYLDSLKLNSEKCNYTEALE